MASSGQSVSFARHLTSAVFNFSRVKECHRPDRAPPRAGGVALEAAVGHRLAAAGLVGRVGHVEPESLQQFERCDPDFGEEHEAGVTFKWKDYRIKGHGSRF